MTKSRFKGTDTRYGGLTKQGQELPDPKPLILDAHSVPPTMEQQIARAIAVSLHKEAEQRGKESFDEANDFDVDEPFDMPMPESKYEILDEEYLRPPPGLSDEDNPNIPQDPEAPEPEGPSEVQDQKA